MNSNQVTFCRQCLYGDSHPLGLTISEDGLCSGCIIHEEKNYLDWNYRWKKLEKLADEYRTKKNLNYDCIVPVTGGQDSYYIMHIVKNKLGLNPLMVTYNKYFNTPLGIRNLSNLRIKFNSDILIQNVNPISVKKIIRTTLREFGSMYWANIAGQTVFPVQTSIRKKIPLIIWGAHQGIEQVGMFSHENEVEMTRRYRKDHDLMGYEADDLLNAFDILKERDIWQFRYPDNAVLRNNNVRGIYLSNYIRWDPIAQHREMVKLYDYKTANLSRTFDIYDYNDCYNYLDIHDLLKLNKHGYSKVTDHVSREIRHKRISKDDGEKIVNKYEQAKYKYKNQFLSFLDVTEKGLDLICDYHKNKNFWNDADFSSWVFNGWSRMRNLDNRDHSKKNIMNEKHNLEQLALDSIELGMSPEYITFGKGWP